MHRFYGKLARIEFDDSRAVDREKQLPCKAAAVAGELNPASRGNLQGRGSIEAA